MEGGRFLLAVILMIAVVIITNIVIPPAPPPGVELPADSALAPEVPPPPSPPAATAAPDTGTAAPAVIAPAPDAPAQADAPADTIILTSPLWRYGISNRGGAITVADLLQYESLTQPGSPVGLVPEDRGLYRYRLRIGDREIDLSSLSFNVMPPESPGLAQGAGPDSVRLAWDDGAGNGIQLLYRFDPDRYLVDAELRVTGTGGTTPQLLIDFGPTLPFHEWNEREEQGTLAYVVNNPQGDGIESVRLDDVRSERIDNGPFVWVALKNKYFLAAVIQATAEPMPFGGVIARPGATEYSADLTTTLLPRATGEFAWRIYLGPQQYDRLAAVGHQLTDVNPYGWRFLRPVIRPLAHGISWLLLQMHNVFNLAYGWVLILFGVLIRVLLWPLNAKAMRSQMKSMELQPRLKEIQTKYKSDPERLQKEMLRLYKEEGFNPMGGCLPLLIPFPVLITLFFVFQATIEFRGVPFLWLPDLSRPDPYYIIPILMGASMFMLQWLSMRSTPQPNPQMKMMMWFMPIFMTILFVNFASGLNLYYTAMNLASLPQQWMIARERRAWHAARGATREDGVPAKR